jgi:hypothetical protein
MLLGLAAWQFATSGLTSACMGSHVLQQQQHERETCVLHAWWLCLPCHGCLYLSCVNLDTCWHVAAFLPAWVGLSMHVR